MLTTNKARQEGFVLLDEVLTMWTGVDRACKCQKEWRERKTTMRDVSRANTLHSQSNHTSANMPERDRNGKPIPYPNIRQSRHNYRSIMNYLMTNPKQPPEATHHPNNTIFHHRKCIDDVHKKHIYIHHLKHKPWAKDQSLKLKR